MKKILAMLSLFLISGFLAIGQTTWNRKNGPTGGTVKDVEYNQATGKAFGLIENRTFVSADDGVSWTALTFSGSNSYFYDIEIANNVIYLINGYDVYTSTDGGLTFSKKNTDFVLSNAYKLKRLSSGTLIALASNAIYSSINNGVSWVAGASGSFNSNYLVVNNLDQIFVISSGTGLPLRSTDGGATFTAPTNTGITMGGTVYSLTANNSGSLIYGVNAAGLWSSTNGNSWTSIKGGSISDATVASGTESASFIEFSGDGLGMYFIDNVNKKLHFKGVSELASAWQLATAFPGTNLSVTCSSAKNYATPLTSTAIFGTSFIGLFRTTSGGGTMLNANSGVTGIRPTQLVFADNGDMIVNASSIGLIRSSTDGDSWTRVTTVPPSVAKLSTNSAQNNIFALSQSPVYDLYRSQDRGVTWTNLTTPVDFKWASGSDNDRVFALQTNNTSFYYSNNNGTNWSTPIVITGLPLSYGVFSENRISLASSSRMLLELYNYDVAAYEYWRIDFTIGAGLTITGAATKIQTTLPFGGSISKIIAANGRFYAYTNSTNPDQVATSNNGGATWTTASAPTSSGEMFIANNGYIFNSSNSDNKLFVSRDNGATFAVETNLPSTVSPYDIQDVVLNPSGFAYLAVDLEFVHKSNITVVTPVAPSGLAQAGRSATAVALKWNDNSLVEDYYQIEISTNGVDFSNVGQSDGSCSSPSPTGYFVVQGLTVNTAYTFRVKAVNDAGSSAAVTLAVTTLSASTPSIPDNRSWDAVNSGETGNAVVTPKIVGVKHLGGGKYEISDVTLGAGGISSRKDVFFEGSAQTLLVTDNGSSGSIKPNSNGTWNGTNTLTLKWRECYSNDDAINDTETITLTLRTSAPAPAAPTGVSALIASNSTIEISWLQGYYEKEYVVERSLNSGSGFSAIATVQYPATNFIDNGPFVNATTYYYRVKSRNANASPLESPYSTESSAIFSKPNFVVSNTTVSNFIATTIGSYWADFNNDGLEDLFSLSYDFTTEFGSPVIFKDLGTGNFLQMPISFGTEKYIFGFTADLNNDGFSDIALSIQDKAKYDIYKGNGDFTFTKLTDLEKGDIALISGRITGSSTADFNNDGKLDILLLVNDGPLNIKRPELYKQNAGGSFTKIAGGDLGLDVNQYTSGSWADYDNDGDQDFVLANTGGACSLYKNNGNETFTLTNGTGFDAANAFSLAWGDYNNDGNLDLYAGITSQTALYKNNGNGTFTKDISTSISEAFFGISPSWGDINNDGLLDIITPMFVSGPGSRIFINTSTASTTSFSRIITEKLSDPKNSHYGLGLHDYDKDGFLDVFMSSFRITSGDPSPVNAYLYRNNNTTGNWTQIKLAGITSNKRGIGSRISVTAGGKTYIREVASLASLNSQNSPIVHVGIGAASTITNIQIKWPSGIIQNYPNAPINQILLVPEDGQSPILVTQLPAVVATGVSTNTPIEVTFSEASVAIAGKKLTITGVGDPSPFASIDVATAVKAGNKFTFMLPTKLSASKQYSITLDAGAFTDIYGNPSLVLSSGWTFTTDAGPSVSLFGPAHNATNIAVSVPIELTFNKSVTAVAAKKIKILDGATVVLDVDVSTTGTTSAAKYSLPAPTSGWPFLKTLSVLVDAGAFVDANQNDFGGLIAGQYSFTTIEATDVTKPIFASFTPLASLNKGFGTTSFALDITDNKAVTSAKIFVRNISGSTFTEAPGTFNTTTSKWGFSIAETSFDATGAQYYFEAKDAANNIARSPDGTAYHQTYLKYVTDLQIPDAVIGVGGKKTDWKVIAIPFDLPNGGIATVFDELKDKVNTVDYRLLTYKDELAWAEYPSSNLSTFTRGKGYFINLKTQIPLTIGANLIPPNNTRASLFKVSLQKGWNMIGNPYLTPISWADVATLNSLSGQASELLVYNGTSYAKSTTPLSPYTGGFVFAAAAINDISIPFLGQTATGGRKEVPFAEGDWMLPISLKHGETENDLGGVGMNIQAVESFDDLDRVNPPRFLDFAEINFAHPDHFAKRFSRDVVPTQNEYTWEFTVDTNLSGTSELSWGDLSSVTKELFLYDRQKEMLVDMKEQNAYSFNAQQSSIFRIYFGENLSSKIKPESIYLGDAHPNPSTGNVTIPFTLPDVGSLYQVALEVYDMMGKKITTLVEGQLKPGFYSSKWETVQSNLSNGLYVYRMRVAGKDKSEVLSGKIILNK
jgi:ASPIC and UnbV/Bacterial Ig-like domain/FG-GAP-like repeat/Fibronectin type III domain